MRCAGEDLVIVGRLVSFGDFQTPFSCSCRLNEHAEGHSMCKPAGHFTHEIAVKSRMYTARENWWGLLSAQLAEAGLTELHNFIGALSVHAFVWSKARVCNMGVVVLFATESNCLNVHHLHIQKNTVVAQKSAQRSRHETLTLSLPH